MADWLQEYAQEVLNIASETCSFYYSGNRSIHLHSPLFVTGDNLSWLRERTEQFCNETGTDLDHSVYKRSNSSAFQVQIINVIHPSRRPK